MVQVKAIPQTCLGLLFIFSTSSTYTIDYQCEWDLYFCDNPYSIDRTLQFRCKDVDDCPINFMCCNHRCFRHKICQPYKNIRHTSKAPLDNLEVKPGECNVIVTCDTPLPEAFTKSFECFQDNDCPAYYKCCFVTCYNHKVCQPARHIFGVIATNPVILTTRNVTSDTKISYSESSIGSTSTAATSETISSDATKPTANMVKATEQLTTITEPTTVVEVLKPTLEVGIDTTTNKSLVALTTLTTTPEVTSHETRTESLTETPILTTEKISRLTTIREILTEPHPSTDDFEASGDLETDDDEDGRKETKYDTSTTTAHHTDDVQNLTESTIKVTPQSLTTNLITDNDDFEGSGDLMIIDDDEDEWNKNESDEQEVIINSATVTLTTTSPRIRTTQARSFHRSTKSDAETDDFELTEDYEDKKNGREMDNSMKQENTTQVESLRSKNYITTIYQIRRTNGYTDVTPTVIRSEPPTASSVETGNLVSNGSLETIRSDTQQRKQEERKAITSFTTTFTTITTIEQAQTNNDSIEAAVTTQAQPLGKSTVLFPKVDDFGQNKDLKITDDEAITVTANYSQPPSAKTGHLESNGNLGTEYKATTSSTTTSLTLTTSELAQTNSETVVTTQAPPIRETTVIFTKVDDFKPREDLEMITSDKDVNKINDTTIKFMRSTETTITTQRTTSTKDSTEGTVKTNQSQLLMGRIMPNVAGSGDSEASGDFDIIGDDEDERVEGSGTITDIEASGDLEIIGDDEE